MVAGTKSNKIVIGVDRKIISVKCTTTTCVAAFFFPPENEIWECHANNTNIAEAAHAQANRGGKQLKLLTAIMRGGKQKEILKESKKKVPIQDINNQEKPEERGVKRRHNKQKYKTKKSRVDVIEINSDQENEDQDIILNIEIEERKNAIN
ncbi:hypothetical protein RhiirC2_715454 [Rhizophagus irregularis]|uniref:Uncharacterized protein n=1 Tax=Rhizophagus irregularis TaxID=588596 RepID=A0A2N1MVC1_9GLOM|nr:hypothetical protein RhiirC2_715454 [Rhizophagus irregularis]